MKVKPFRIPKPIDDNLVVQVDKGTAFYGLLHQHQEIQLSYILSGHGSLLVSDSIHSFETGDIFIINGHTPHIFQSAATSDNNQMISLFFTKNGFGERFFELPELSEVGQLLATIGSGKRIDSRKKAIRRMMVQLPTMDKFERFLSLLKILKKLKNARKHSLSGFVSPKRISFSDGNRLRLVFDYGIKHFHEEITLTKISDLAHMTPPAFCRFFKQHTNKTFFEFLIALRIAHACQLLMGSERLAVAEISERSGFKSVSNFNRQFKKIKGMTPSTYKRRIMAPLP